MNMEHTFDSSAETLKHIKRVSQLLNMVAIEMINRGNVHDQSKLEEPEKGWFDEATPRLAGLTYGTPEYHENCKLLKPALQHHYENNRHHPQHFEDGVFDMSLFDVVEMLFDWLAATERGVGGDIYKSIELNKKRFKISDQLAQILINTIHYVESYKLT